MSDTTVRNIIEKRLQDNWVLTPIDFDNLRFKLKRGSPFIAVVISEDDSRNKGFKCVQRVYSLTIEVRVPKNSGSVTIDSYCVLLKSLFEGYSEGDFFCLSGRTVRAGNSKQWLQKNVIFQCKYKDANY